MDEKRFFFTEWNVYEVYAEDAEAAREIRDAWLDNDEVHAAVKHTNCGTDWDEQ